MFSWKNKQTNTALTTHCLRLQTAPDNAVTHSPQHRTLSFLPAHSAGYACQQWSLPFPCLPQSHSGPVSASFLSPQTAKPQQSQNSLVCLRGATLTGSHMIHPGKGAVFKAASTPVSHPCLANPASYLWAS